MTIYSQWVNKLNKLFDQRGYSFNIRKKNASAVYWQCVVRNKSMQCKASVIQRGNQFTEGLHTHYHRAQTGAAKVHAIRTELKRRAGQNIFTSAAVMAEEIINE